MIQPPPDSLGTGRTLVRRLPSLRAVLAFEATARNLSLARAAQELNLTSGALSHSIAGLESQLGVKLLPRLRNGVALTPAGREILGDVRAALVHLDAAFPPLSRPDPATLSLSVLPSFATRWLVPRLAAFKAFAPEIRIDLNATEEVTEFDIDRRADVAIRFGPGGWEGVEAIRILDERVFAVAAPGFNGGVFPKSIAELAEGELITNPWQPWRPWFAAAGVEWDDSEAAIVIRESSLVVQAAVEGVGVALVRGMLADRDLKAGRLVRLFPHEVPSEYAYWLVWPKATRKRPLIDRFAAWLADEVAAVAPAIPE